MGNTFKTRVRVFVDDIFDWIDHIDGMDLDELSSTKYPFSDLSIFNTRSLLIEMKFQFNHQYSQICTEKLWSKQKP